MLLDVRCVEYDVRDGYDEVDDVEVDLLVREEYGEDEYQVQTEQSRQQWYCVKVCSC